MKNNKICIVTGASRGAVDTLIVLLYAFCEDVCPVRNVNVLKSKLLLPTLSIIKLRSLFFTMVLQT